MLVALFTLLLDEVVKARVEGHPVGLVIVAMRMCSPFVAVLPVLAISYFRSTRNQSRYVSKSLKAGMARVSVLSKKTRKNGGQNACWVCEDASNSGKLVGCLLLGGNEIEVLVVSEDHRRRGVASELVRLAEAHCKTAEVARGGERREADSEARALFQGKGPVGTIRLIVTSVQINALSFYKSLGYRVVRTSVPNLFGESDHFMEKAVF